MILIVGQPHSLAASVADYVKQQMFNANIGNALATYTPVGCAFCS
jgi:hypothetical protein